LPPHTRRPALVTLAWLLNIAGAGALLLVLVLYFAGRPALAVSAASTQQPPWFGREIAPSPPSWYGLPAVPANPRSTSIVSSSPTPFVLASGHPLRIGMSISGRPLELYQFGDGPHNRMIVAGIHGGHEWNTIALADQLIEHVDSHRELIPSDVTLFILRDLNPDGDARAHGYRGRVNDRGVDLNRNFPVNWQKSWDREGCWDLGPTTAGSEPGSEPETRALMGFLVTRPIEVLISYHSAALGVFPGGDPWDDDSIRFATSLAGVTGYPFPPIDTGCIYTGTLADFAVSRGATAVDMELANHADTDFELNLKALELLLAWEPAR
jgi:predicted deacylase